MLNYNIINKISIVLFFLFIIFFCKAVKFYSRVVSIYWSIRGIPPRLAVVAAKRKPGTTVLGIYVYCKVNGEGL